MMNDVQRTNPGQQDNDGHDIEEKSQEIIDELIETGRLDEMVDEPTVLIQLPA
jgi:hypothetical protein